MFLPDDGSSTLIHTTHITRDRNRHIDNEILLTFFGGKKRRQQKKKAKMNKCLNGEQKEMRFEWGMPLQVFSVWVLKDNP